jgi:TRAP-type C4-dicarboxylate transport system permease small subunit
VTAAPIPPAVDPAAPPRRRGLDRFLRAVITGWALAGGFLVLGLAIYTAASAVRNIITGAPLPGEYELAMHFVAVAIFSFLPYCQITGANVTVDVLTEGMGERGKALMAAFSSIFAIAFAGLLLRQMSLGLQDYLRYPEMTPILHMPLWTAFPPILFSLFLLLVASVMTFVEGWQKARRPNRHPPAGAAV